MAKSFLVISESVILPLSSSGFKGKACPLLFPPDYPRQTDAKEI
jgi:hypothetical protein